MEQALRLGLIRLYHVSLGHWILFALGVYGGIRERESGILFF